MRKWLLVLEMALAAVLGAASATVLEKALAVASARMEQEKVQQVIGMVPDALKH